MKLSAIFIVLCILFFAVTTMATDYVIIINKSNTVTSVSAAEMKRLYTGKISDISGKKILPATLALDDPASIAFLKEVVGMSIPDYKSFWLAEQVRGGSTAPAVKKVTSTMLSFVSDNQNAIGYVESGSVTDNVKVITIK